jgi:cellulose synthase/poly-beta-1,6-N-acetylglucosamine synthase-like glycosyltransferase
MKTILFFAMASFVLAWLWRRMRLSPLRAFGQIDAVLPAFNEELCIEESIRNLLANPYIRSVIVVNDGSTDSTGEIIDRFASSEPRIVPVHQANTGKGGALNAGIARAEAPFVFLSDSDTVLPPTKDGLGYMLAEMARGADAVGGIPASNLRGAGLLPHIRATVKVPMIVLKRTFQQIVGGAPFIISGACGLFRTAVLREIPFSDRTKVEDLDLSWSLVAAGYRVRQCNCCVVYSQECNELKTEWRRWRRWIVGYAVCMRLHRRLLLTRFGLLTILPMFAVVILGCAAYLTMIAIPLAKGEGLSALLLLFPLLWIQIVCVIGLVSAVHHRRASLIFLAPAALVYVLLAYAIWAVHGIAGLFTGREPLRDKPVRYAHALVD